MHSFLTDESGFYRLISSSGMRNSGIGGGFDAGGGSGDCGN